MDRHNLPDHIETTHNTVAQRNLQRPISQEHQREHLERSTQTHFIFFIKTLNLCACVRGNL